MKFKKIKLIDNLQKIPSSENFVFAALNLAFLSYLCFGSIKISKNLFLWCDGIVGQILYNSKKIHGSLFIKKFYKFNFKEIIVFGNHSSKQIIFLKKKFQTNVRGINLPKITEKNIKNYIPKLKKNSLILITLPTPKQEKLSHEIIKKNKNYKIICIGGGLSIATGEIKKCPEILSKFGLEFVWRLRTDTSRRLVRLLFTSFLLLFYYFTGKLREFKIVKIQ